MATEEWPKYAHDIPYSDISRLNTLETCIPRPTSSNDSKRVWIVYVHGGAWRDPLVDASSFRKTQGILLASNAAESIAGYASINYRLSSYPSHGTEPSNPSDHARNARHPHHITDVLTAILHLQETYRFEERYILVGHSCGATLALQVAMKRFWGSQYESTLALELNVVPPLAIVGLEGIYDIPALVQAHDSVYRDFIINAFGNKGWDEVSPTNCDYNETWPNGKLVVLGHSPDDQLVEMAQPDMQADTFARLSWNEEGDRRLLRITLTGEHNEIWTTDQAAKAILFALEELDKIA